MTDLAAHARAIIDANLYLTLGTTDPDGRPWSSPVYFAPVGDREFCWQSATDARHSRHLAQRPHVSMVIFDSTVAPYHGRAVYAVGEARELSGSDLDRALAVYPQGRSVRRHAGLSRVGGGEDVDADRGVAAGCAVASFRGAGDVLGDRPFDHAGAGP